jgi:four helix bundle protein
MSYKNLEIWKISDHLVIEIHRMTVKDLPAFEMYETGSQIRRSIKSVKANIVEGYGRNRSKKEFLHFLNIALASALESIDHLETLYKTGSLQDKGKYEYLADKLDHLGKGLRRFIFAVNSTHRTSNNEHPLTSNIQSSPVTLFIPW